jgi:hypothetical protein
MKVYRQQLASVVGATVGDPVVNGADTEVLPRAVVFILNVTKADGNTPTLDVDIEARDPVSGVYFVIESFTQVTGSVTSERKVNTALYEGTLRAAWAITQVAAADYDFTVSFQGKEGDEN